MIVVPDYDELPKSVCALLELTRPPKRSPLSRAPPASLPDGYPTSLAPPTTDSALLLATMPLAFDKTGAAGIVCDYASLFMSMTIVRILVLCFHFVSA